MRELLQLLIILFLLWFLGSVLVVLLKYLLDPSQPAFYIFVSCLIGAALLWALVFAVKSTVRAATKRRDAREKAALVTEIEQRDADEKASAAVTELQRLVIFMRTNADKSFYGRIPADALALSLSESLDEIVKHPLDLKSAIKNEVVQGDVAALLGRLKSMQFADDVVRDRIIRVLVS